MDNVKLAGELVKLAKALTSADNDSVEKMDTSLNAIVNKVVQETDGDLSKMLTVIVMALKKSGNSSEATKIHSLFKQLIKKV